MWSQAVPPLIPEALQYGAFGLLALVLIGCFALLRWALQSREKEVLQTAAERSAERESRKVASDQYKSLFVDARTEFVKSLQAQQVLYQQDYAQKRQDFLTALQHQQGQFGTMLLNVQKQFDTMQEHSEKRWRSAVEVLSKDMQELTLSIQGLRDEVLLFTGAMKRRPKEDEK